MTLSTNNEVDWFDPSSPWCAKLDRAREHITTLRAEVDAFASRAYSVDCAPGTNAGDTVIRLRITEDLPVRVMTIVGDALHNMRSALDAFAYALAERHAARRLTPDEQRACAFPIVETPTELAKFWNDRRRSHLFGPAERGAIESGLPGWEWDEAPEDVRAMYGTRESVVQRDPLWVLHSLSNIDKHRRLHATAWQTRDVYWGSVLSEDQYLWNPGDTPPWVDGAVIGTITTTNRAWRVPPELITATIEPRLAEPVVEHNSIPDAMNYLHGHITGWVLPRSVETLRLPSSGIVTPPR